MLVNCYLIYLKYKIIKHWVKYAAEQTFTDMSNVMFFKLFFKPGSAPRLEVWHNSVLQKISNYSNLHINCFFLFTQHWEDKGFIKSWHRAN